MVGLRKLHDAKAHFLKDGWKSLTERPDIAPAFSDGIFTPESSLFKDESIALLLEADRLDRKQLCTMLANAQQIKDGNADALKNHTFSLYLFAQAVDWDMARDVLNNCRQTYGAAEEVTLIDANGNKNVFSI